MTACGAQNGGVANDSCHWPRGFGPCDSLAELGRESG